MNMNPLILIVDDEPSGREAIESVLINQGYSLAFAADGAEALAQAKRLLPDVILLDVMMPDLNGFEVCCRLRADPQLAEVPVVMVTALDDRDSRLQGIESGADDFITKPIDRAELRARLRTITRLNRYRRLQDERAKLERQLARMTALRTIDLAITGSMDLSVTLNILLQQVIEQLSVDAATILVLNPHTLVLEYSVGRGFRSDKIEHLRVRMGEGPAGRAVVDRRMIYLPDFETEPAANPRAGALRDENFQSYFAVPLLAKGQVAGVLEIFHRTPLDPDAEWLNFLEALGGQAAIAIENARLFDDLQRANIDLKLAYDATLEGWSRALDLRDREKEGHTQRVTILALALAVEMGVSDSELIDIRRGAILHDIGKMAIPDRILLKDGPLSGAEWEIMRQHPVYAYQLLSPVAYLRPALHIPYCHHEKWDGTGYPQGLKGEQIPLAARIFAVVDVWDALRSDRPYRPKWADQAAAKTIRALAGTHFDPAVVEAFFKLPAVREVIKHVSS
jgi:response regulator RpfG family c-di-GMP phosphodiesterase